MIRWVAAIILLYPLHVTAYEVDYELSGYFLVERHNPTYSTPTSIEVWHIDFMRGLVNNDPTIHDLTIVTNEFALNKATNCYQPRHVYVYEYDQTSRFNTLLFAGNNMTFEDGAIRKFTVSIKFNSNGALNDISGSLYSTTNPTNISTYKLLKKTEKICITQFNDYVTKDYIFQNRK